MSTLRTALAGQADRNPDDHTKAAARGRARMVETLREVLREYEESRERWIAEHETFDEEAFHAWFSGQVHPNCVNRSPAGGSKKI